MRVLFLHSRLGDHGGADRWLLGVLSALGPDVDASLAVGRVDSDPVDPGVPWTRCPGLDRSGLRGRGQAKAVAALTRTLSAAEPDLIVVNDVVDPALLTLVAHTGRGVLVCQDHRFFCPGAGKVLPDGTACGTPMGPVCAGCLPDAQYRGRIVALTEARLAAAQGMAQIWVLSVYMAEALADVGVDPGCLRVIPPFVHGLDGVEARRVGPRHHLLAGRLSAHKGVDTALEAALLMTGRTPLVVAGQGPLMDRVRAAAAHDGDRVRAVGWQDRAGMADLLSGACSVWLPSIWAEPFGIIGIEAMAAGVPVLAADVGGVRDWLVDGVTGCLHRPGDARALAAQADRVDGEPEWAAALGQAGRARVRECFGQDAVAQAMRAELEALVTAVR